MCKVMCPSLEQFFSVSGSPEAAGPLWAAKEPLTFHVSQAKVGELPKVDKGHDSAEDGSRC